MGNIAEVVVGVDVSKKHLDIYINPVGKSIQISNSQQGISKLFAQLSKHIVEQVAFESSGGYEYLLQKNLAEKNYKLWCIDPKRIKAFTISEGIKAKTDKIDAKMIACFAAKNKSTYTHKVLPKDILKLKAYARRRVDLTEMISLEKKRQSHPKEVFCKKLIEKHINHMQKLVEKIETEIMQMIDKNKKWKRKAEIMQSAPGIGKITALTLIAYVPELGELDSKKISALIGVAPFTKQSGAYQGVEKIQDGRSIPRKALYMASLSAIHGNSSFSAFYSRLIEAGKRPKVALVAVMHKMIITLNAMVQKDQMWKT